MNENKDEASKNILNIMAELNLLAGADYENASKELAGADYENASKELVMIMGEINLLKAYFDAGRLDENDYKQTVATIKEISVVAARLRRRCDKYFTGDEILKRQG